MSSEMPIIEGYEILSLLGVGGMSKVWKAYDRERKEVVAIKILSSEHSRDREEVELFHAEENAMREISHPGIVKSYKIAPYRDTYFYVMEYVDGYNFGSLLARKQHLNETDCLLICESIASALDYAWNYHGLVHCDIKPENIMINSDGIIKLTDLGLCHTFHYLKDGMQEIPEHIMGTPAYISPEQVYGDVEPDCRADIYSLGATLYHLATGRMLFPGLNYEDMIRAQCDEQSQAVDPRVYCPNLSHGFCQLLEAMLVKNREERMSSWVDVNDMALSVERGIRFKPRDTSGISTLAIREQNRVICKCNAPPRS